MIGNSYKSVHGTPTITTAQAIKLEANIPYTNCAIKGLVTSVCPLRPREYGVGQVFSCVISDATSGATTRGEKAPTEVVVYFHDAWAVGCSFISVGVELIVKNFGVSKNPNYASGSSVGFLLCTPFLFGNGGSGEVKESPIVLSVMKDSVVSVVSLCEYTDAQIRNDEDGPEEKECMELTLTYDTLDHPTCK
eukprot:PhF_6_TR36018/c0_g1_i2/m.52206